MKARVKATGEVVDVDFDKDALANDWPPYRTNEIPSRFFLAEQLEWIDIKKKAEPDYWEKLLHQYAGMAMQGMISNEYTHKLYLDNKNYPNGLLNDSIKIATALVEKLKEESKC